MRNSQEDTEVHRALPDKLTNVNTSNGAEDGENLPYPVIEKIVAAIPFPQVYGIKLISKRMHSNFQALVSRNSSTWPTYCPAFVFNDKLLGFDKSNNVWRTFTYRPLVAVSTEFPPPSIAGASVAGALICMYERSRDGPVVTVKNFLTRRERTLPPLPIEDDPSVNWCRPILLPLSKEDYKVILYGISCKMGDGPQLGAYLETRTYDSSSLSSAPRVWTKQSTSVTFASCSRCNVYLNGNLYFMWPWNDRSFSFFQYTGTLCVINVFRFNLESGSLTKVGSLEIRYETLFESYLKLCGSSILLVVIDRAPANKATVTLYQLFENSLSLVKLSSCTLFRGDESTGYWVASIDLVGEDDCLHVCDKYVMTTYTISSDSWKSFPPLPESYPFRFLPKSTVNFQPGLNPFAIP